MQVDCWWQHRNRALVWRAWFRNWTNEDLTAALEAASLPGVDNFDCSHWTTVSSSPWREVMLQSECCPEDAPEDSKPSVRATATLLSDGAVAVMQRNGVHGAKQVSVARELTWTFGETILYVEMTNWNYEKLAIVTTKLQTNMQGERWWSWKTAEVRAEDLVTLCFANSWCTAQVSSEIQAAWEPPHDALRVSSSSGV